MKDCNCKNKPFAVESVHDLDIDELSTPIDYLFGIRSVKEKADDVPGMSPVLIPGEKIVPASMRANLISLDTNNDSLVIPENQVRAGYLDVQPGGLIMRLADASHKAMFLMVENAPNGRMLVQSTGFLHMAGGHSFIPAAQYYLGENGEPVTDETITGQKLFIPLNDHYLLVNGDF